MNGIAGLSGLFLAAFVAATLVPAQSEGVLAAMVAAETHAIPLLIAVASAGNVLGSVVNWLFGCGIDRFRNSKWFPVGPEALDRAAIRYRRWGRWSLLLSWMPVIGDPLTVVAGVLREPFWSFLALVTIAKTARYLAVAALASSWL